MILDPIEPLIKCIKNVIGCLTYVKQAKFLLKLESNRAQRAKFISYKTNYILPVLLVFAPDFMVRFRWCERRHISKKPRLTSPLLFA